MASPLKISARVDIDASGAKKGAADSNAAVASIGSTAEQTRQKLDELNKAAQNGLRAPLGTGPGGAGADLDKLRAKFNPLYAAISQYKVAQGEIRQAHAAGAISADEMSAALSRNRQATLASIDAIKGRNKAINDTPGGQSGNQKFQSANLAFQVQDIITTAPFMPISTVMLQQGPQIAAVMDGLDDKAAGLRTAFMSLISPWSLISMAAVGATAFVIQYLSKVSSGTKSVEDILQRHADNIEALGPAYKKAFDEQQRYVGLNPDLATKRMQDDQSDALKRMVEEARGAASEISTAMSGNIWGARGDNSFLRFGAARDALVEFRQSIEAGTPKVAEFQRQINGLEASGNLSAEAARKLRDFSAAALKAEEDLAKVRNKDVLAASFAQLQTAIDSVNPYGLSGRLGELDGKLDELYKRMRAGKIDSAELNRSIVSLSQANPDMSGAIAEIGRVGQAALSALASVNALARGDVTTPKTGRVVNDAGRAAAINFNARTSDEDDGIVKKLEDQAERLKRANEKAARSGSADRNAYRDLIKSADDRIGQMKLEAEASGLTGIAADTLRFKLDLLQQSEDKGRSLTSAQKAAIDARVESFKQYAEQAAKARLAADLLFDRQQLGRSAMDQQIASGLRGAGLPVDFASFEAGLIRTNLQLEYARDLAGDFTDTFFGALDQGKSVWEAFGDAGVSALKRIADTLLNDVLNSLFSVSGSGSSGGGLFGSLFSGLFGGGSKSAFSWGSSGDFDFDKGGYTGPGGIREPAGVVHRGEVVWSQRDVARAGGVHTVEAMRLGRRGYEAGGMVGVDRLYSNRQAAAVSGASSGAISLSVKLGLDVDDNGNIMPIIRRVVAEDAPGIAVRVVDDFSSNGLPDRMSQINDNPRWR